MPAHSAGDSSLKKIRAGGVELQLLDRGQGRPILFAHGCPFDHAMWIEQYSALPPGWRAIVPDLRGFGGSQITPGTVSMEQMADDLAALLDALDVHEPIVFCGLSMGGYIAWPFLRKHAPRVRALVLCDTRAAADSPETIVSRMKLMEHVLRAGTQYAAEAMLPRLFAADSFERIAPKIAAINRTIVDSHPQAIAAALRGIAARPDSTPLLAGIHLPTLVMAGEYDAISPPEEMREMAAAIPGARFELIPEAGHMAPLENPAAFNRALWEFLGRLPS